MYPTPAGQPGQLGQPPYQQQYGSGYNPQAAAHAPQQAAYGQPPYQQPPYSQQRPYGQQPPASQQYTTPAHQRPSSFSAQSGHIAKKQKGNPVITRYAPPPGYVPPPNAQIPAHMPYQQPAYPPHAPAYGAPQYAPQAGGYQHAPTYQAQPYQQHQQYQQPPPQGYPPQPVYVQQAGYPHQPGYSHNQPFQQPPYPQQHQPQQPPYQPQQSYAAPQPGYPPPASNPFTEPTQAWHPPPQSATSRQVSFSVPNPTPPGSIAGGGDGSVDYGFDLDFESEAPFSKDPDAIQAELSLGVVIWHAPGATKSALPSTFAEAELEALAPGKPRKGEDESISQYFIKDRLHVIGLCVKQTEEWESIKGDLIFVEFPARCETVSIQTVIANRNRPDPSDDPGDEPEELPPTQGYQRAGSVASHETRMGAHELRGGERPGSEQADGDQAMDLSSDEEEDADRSQQPPVTSIEQRPPKTSNVLDNLEQALGGGGYSPRKQSITSLAAPNTGRDRWAARPRHSRSRSPVKAQPGPLPRDDAQENILAALGVEGSPKMVFATPGPAFGPTMGSVSGPPPGQGAPHAFGQPPHKLNPVQFGPGLHVPPPPPGQRSPSYDPWKAHEATNGHGGDSPRSATSHHTMIGSDFHPDDTDVDATPRAKPWPVERSDSSRKRPFDEAAEADTDGRRRQDDDVTPKMRRTRPRVAAAYR